MIRGFPQLIEAQNRENAKFFADLPAAPSQYHSQEHPRNSKNKILKTIDSSWFSMMVMLCYAISCYIMLYLYCSLIYFDDFIWFHMISFSWPCETRSPVCDRARAATWSDTERTHPTVHMDAGGWSSKPSAAKKKPWTNDFLGLQNSKSHGAVMCSEYHVGRVSRCFKKSRKPSTISFVHFSMFFPI